MPIAWFQRTHFRTEVQRIYTPRVRRCDILMLSNVICKVACDGLPKIVVVTIKERATDGMVSNSTL